MPHKGIANPVSKLTEHITQATKANNGYSTPPVVETMDEATVTKTC